MNENKKIAYICKTNESRHTKECCEYPCRIFATVGDFPPDICPFDGSKQIFKELKFFIA